MAALLPQSPYWLGEYTGQQTTYVGERGTVDLSAVVGVDIPSSPGEVDAGIMPGGEHYAPSPSVPNPAWVGPPTEFHNGATNWEPGEDFPYSYTLHDLNPQTEQLTTGGAPYQLSVNVQGPVTGRSHEWLGRADLPTPETPAYYGVVVGGQDYGNMARAAYMSQALQARYTAEASTNALFAAI